MKERQTMGPRLARPEDDDERGLPPDLTLLAEQLSADAQWLAERYPAGTPELSPAVRVRRRPWGVAAAAAAIFATVIWSASRWLPAPNEPALQTAAVLAIPTAAPPTAGGPILLDNPQPTEALSAPLRALGGGEQEGVLDLLEEQSLPQTSLSI